MKDTEKQIKYLKKLGIPTKGLTKQEASSIISKYYGKNVYRCRNCNGLVIEKDNTLECCGFKQRSNT